MLEGKWYNFILLGVAVSAFFLKFSNFAWLELYLFAVFSVLVLLLNSKFFKNLNTYAEFILFWFGAFVLKICADYYMSADISKVYTQLIQIIPFLMFLGLIVCCKKYEGDRGDKIRKRTWGNYFPEREDDLRRLEDIVDKTDINLLTLDAAWGQGKSFLLQKFKEDREAQGDIVIVIDVLSLRLDNFQEYLIYELNRTLLSCGYLSRNSNLLRSIMKRAHADIFSTIFGKGKKHFGDTFYDFQQELLRQGKNIILIYDDIDRSENKELIRTILYLSEKLTSQNNADFPGRIKVIFQYSMEHMEQLGFQNDFLEKFCNQKIGLTYIPLRRLLLEIQKQLYPRQDSVLKDEDIGRLAPYLYLGRMGLFPDEQVRAEHYLHSHTTIRRAKNMIKSLVGDSQVLPSDFRTSQPNRNTWIVMRYVEQFLPNVYDAMRSMNLRDVFCLHYNVKNETREISLFELVNLKQEDDYYNIDILLSEDKYPENFERYLVWRMLGLDGVLHSEETDQMDTEGPVDLPEFYRRDVRRMRMIDDLDYEDIEQGVRFILAAGTASVNHYIYYANKMVTEVLQQPEAERKRAFQTWAQHMYQEEQGVQTIQRLGISVWWSLFHAFAFTSKYWSEDEKRENYCALIRFYFQEKAVEKFDQKLLDELLPLWDGMPAGIPEIFVEVVTKLASLSICNSWNNYENFFVFLSRSLGALYRSGMIEGVDPWLIANLADIAHEEASEVSKVRNGKALGKSKQLATELIHKACREAGQHRAFLKECDTDSCLSRYVQYYETTLHYLAKIEKIMKCTSKGKVRYQPYIQSKWYSGDADAVKETEKLMKASNPVQVAGENPRNLKLVRLIELLKESNLGG